jgi:Transposase, Mutator family
MNYKHKEAVWWIPHIDGVPFRKLGDERGASGVTAYTEVFRELESLPECLEITRMLCAYSSGIFVIDGKYIKVRGYREKIPFMYGIDYETHDILFGVLARAEDTTTFLNIFSTLKRLNYPLQIVVADDRSSLPIALKQVFPDIPLQLCQNHYLENIRQRLHLRTDPTHHHFFNSLKKHVFDDYTDNKGLDGALHHVFTNHGEGNPLREHIIMDIHNRRKELFAYVFVENCPDNTNLIELFNSHFNARLKSLKGFKTKEHAILWLNGLLIRRRTKTFTDCSPKFKHLNGKSSLQMSIKKQAPWPDILGIYAPKT